MTMIIIIIIEDDYDYNNYIIVLYSGIYIACFFIVFRYLLSNGDYNNLLRWSLIQILSRYSAYILTMTMTMMIMITMMMMMMMMMMTTMMMMMMMMMVMMMMIIIIIIIIITT